MKKQQPSIKSRYNPREVFSYENTPGEFKSVTEESIKNIKAHCNEIINEDYNGTYSPSTLHAMVGTVRGNFDLLVARLKEDYNCRKKKLKKAQNKGIKKANRLILQFNKAVLDYEIAMKRYCKNVDDYDGYPTEDKLQYPRERVEEFKRRLKAIKEKNHEA